MTNNLDQHPEVTIHTPLVPAWELDDAQREIERLRTENEWLRKMLIEANERNAIRLLKE